MGSAIACTRTTIRARREQETSTRFRQDRHQGRSPRLAMNRRSRCTTTTSSEKKLYRTRLYSGIVLRARRLPVSMFSRCAVSRTVGWIAQWKEMIEDPEQKIGRPRQLYTGPTERDYTPRSKRG